MLDAGACTDGIEISISWTPLHKAAEWSDDAIVSELIARGANIDAKIVESLLTPLIIAIEKNRPAIVKRLLDAGADRNTASKGNLTPAHSAARCPNYEIMRMLLEKEVDLNVRSLGKGVIPLHVATGCRHIEIVKMLLKAGGDFNTTSTDGHTALGLAELMHSVDLVETFQHFSETQSARIRDL